MTLKDNLELMPHGVGSARRLSNRPISRQIQRNERCEPHRFSRNILGSLNRECVKLFGCPRADYSSEPCFDRREAWRLYKYRNGSSIHGITLSFRRRKNPGIACFAVSTALRTVVTLHPSLLYFLALVPSHPPVQTSGTPFCLAFQMNR